MRSAPLEFEGFCHEFYVPLVWMLTLYSGDPEVARELADDLYTLHKGEEGHRPRNGSQ